jgi:alpha-mannosidase
MIKSVVFIGTILLAVVQTALAVPIEKEILVVSDFPFAWDAENQPHRQVELSFGDAPLYEAADAIVTCDGERTVTHLEFDFHGRRKMLLPLPAGKADTRTANGKVTVTVTTPRWSKSAEGTIEPAKTWPNLEEVVVIIKTHYDIGFTRRVGEVVNYYRTGMIDMAMQIMEQGKDLPAYQQFELTCPGWVMSKVLDDWQGQTAERKAKLDAYIKSGRLRFHALPFTLESDACEPEEMARGFGFTSDLCRRYNLPLPISGKMTDVPSHGGALATVLGNSGVKFMHIGCNWPSSYVRTPGLFWWEGPDGSRVLTFYSSIYGTATGFNFPHAFGGTDPNVGHNFIPPDDWKYSVWPAIIVTMDNSGPPPAAEVTRLFEEARRQLPGVKIRFGTMDDFANAFLATKPELPVVKGEMPDTWIHGIMCDPGGGKLSRAIHPLLASAEALHTQLGLWGVAQPSIAKDVAAAYEKILLYGEHTWGTFHNIEQFGDNFKNANPSVVATLEASWEDKTDYIRAAAKITQAITDADLKALADNVNAPAGNIIVYNPLPWPRSGRVESDGKTFSVTDVPASGYKVVPAPSSPVSASTSTLESPFFKVTLDPSRGAIASLVDKRTGREWVDAAAERSLGQYLNERFTYEQTAKYCRDYQQGRWGNNLMKEMHKLGMISEKQVPYRAATSANGTVTISGDTATLECPADVTNHMPGTALRVTLPQDQPFIELELTIRDKAKDNWPEADWLCLPFKVANPQLRVYRQLGSMNPATDILTGANRDLFSVGHGVTITDADGSGIAISPIDHPLVSLDRPGCWQFSKDAATFTPKKPIVYLNLYNNQWNTNFRYWYPGTWSSRVRLWTFDAKTPADAVMATPALEARNPLLVVSATGKGKTLPAEQTGISVSRKGTIVTAFGQNPDGAGTLLRIWERAGTSGVITVTLPAGAKFATATPVNLRGEKTGEPLKITDGTLPFKLNQYAPASFALE